MKPAEEFKPRGRIKPFEKATVHFGNINGRLLWHAG